VDRRRFLRQGLGGLAAAAGALSLDGCAPAADRIDLARRLTAAPGPPRSRPPLLASSPSFLDHINRGAGSGVSLGGVDYAPLSGQAETEVCPAAAGVVTSATERNFSAGTVVTVAHGLGWKTEYAHLKRRFASYADPVGRHDVIALMGSSGWGAARGTMGVVVHTHLTLWGPAYTPLFRGVLVQEFPRGNPGFRHALDPEEFSLGGREAALLYSRPEDAGHDARLRAAHLEAVTLADALLDQIDGADAAKIQARTRLERETGFDFRIDDRLWWLWQRLAAGPHPFTPPEVLSHRARMTELMAVVPRLSAPIVEPARRGEYRRRPGG
jgi:hypothetical protein